jgi:SAM-dependent methyltransferase
MTDPPASFGSVFAWEDLRRKFEGLVAQSIVGWVDPKAPHFESQRQFAMSRLQEGLDLVRYFELHHSETRRPGTRFVDVLDVGAGNGGVSLGLANDARFRVTSFDTHPNRELLGLRRKIPVPIGHVVGVGELLPFREACFDVVLLLETLEHVRGPRRLGSEIMRVLKPGGVCMITTPARLRYFFQADPHFGVKGLFMLPDFLQRLYVTKIAKRAFGSGSGTKETYYDVEHIFWHARGILRLFPGRRRMVLFYLPKFTPNGRIGRAIKRRLFGGFFWDRILIYKK